MSSAASIQRAIAHAKANPTVRAPRATTANAYNMGSAEGQKAYKKMNKEEKAAFDYNAQQANLSKAEREMQKILKQQPKRQTSMGSRETIKLKQEAYGTGPLAEYEAMRKQAALAKEQGGQRLQQGLSDELQNLSMNEAGQTANAYSQLAQSGGLSSGARERVAGSMGQQALAARQGQRLQTQRAGETLESQYLQGQQDILGQEAAQRRALQNAYLDMQRGDTEAANQFAQNQYAKKADVAAGLAKAKMDAATNAYRK